MEASALALLHCVVAAARCIRLLRRAGLREGRDWRGQAMEETMSVWTIGELMHLAWKELCNLAGTIERGLALWRPVRSNGFTH